MGGYTDGQLLFYCGAALLILGAVAGVVALVLLALARRRLNKQLTREYGDKRR